MAISSLPEESTGCTGFSLLRACQTAMHMLQTIIMFDRHRQRSSTLSSEGHLGEVVVHALGELLHARGSLLGQLLSELCESCDVTDEHSAIKGLHARLHTPRCRPCSHNNRQSYSCCFTWTATISCWLTLVWVRAASKNMSIMGEEHVRDDKVLANTACRCMFSCSFNANLKGNWHVRTSQSQARQVQLNNVLQCQCLGCEEPSFVHTHGKSLT